MNFNKVQNANRAEESSPLDDSPLQVWEGAPQCPICDGPLQYYTNDGEDYNITYPDEDDIGAFGRIECCQCWWEYDTEDVSEVGVLDKLFVRVRRDRINGYRFRTKEEQ